MTDELGRFQIDSVEAGAYNEREKAQTITLKHRESANNLDVVIKK